MPPTRNKMMKCKLCSKLIDSVDISSHANMHRQQGDIKPAASASTTAAVQSEQTVNALNRQVTDTGTTPAAEPQQHTTSTVESSPDLLVKVATTADSYKSVSHQFVAEMVAGRSAESQLFCCALCEPAFRSASLDAYCEHLAQRSHMQNVFFWLLTADADVVAKYQLLASKIKQSKKSSGLFCELCRKASFNVKDADSHKGHLTSDKHQSTLKHIKALYKEMCGKFTAVQTSTISPLEKLHVSSSSSEVSNKGMAEGGQPEKSQNSETTISKDGDVSKVFPSTSSENRKAPISMKLSDRLNFGNEIKTASNTNAPKTDNDRKLSGDTQKQSYSGLRQRSPSWSPVRNATTPPTASTQAEEAEIEIITIIETKNSSDLRPSSSSSKRHESTNSDRAHSPHRRPSGSQRHADRRSRTPDLRLRLSSSDKGRGRSRSPRRRRSRSRTRASNRHYSDGKRRSPVLVHASYRRRHSSGDRRSWRSRSRSRSPGRRRPHRRSRSRESRGRHRSANRSRRDRSRSRDRHYRRRTRSPDSATVAQKSQPRKRLQPRPLSPWSIDSLTFLVEKEWTAYYEKYYALSGKDDEATLAAQKEYLQAYRGFFTEDPNFDICYSHLVKPEALRTLLTEKIDRGSPGPSSLDPMFNTMHLPESASSASLESGELVDDKTNRELRSNRWEQSLIAKHKGSRLPTSDGPSPADNNSYHPQSVELKRDNRGSYLSQSGELELHEKNLKASRDFERGISQTYVHQRRSQEPGLHFSSRNMVLSPNSQVVTNATVSVPKPVSPPAPSAAHSAESFHSFAKLKALIREKLKIPTTDEEKTLSTIQVPDLVKEALQQIKTDKGKDREPYATTSSANDGELIFSDPFLGFVHNVLSGILKMTGLQDEVDAGNAPAGTRSQLYLEQKRMHDSMVTPEGHLLIRMARMTLTNLGRLESKFGTSHVHVVEILKNLDRDVLQLIADTPMLKQ